MDSRFAIERRDGRARRGKLVLNSVSGSSRILETPALLIHTTRGSSPNLTGDLLQSLGQIAGNYGLQVDLLQLYVMKCRDNWYVPFFLCDFMLLCKQLQV